MNSKKIDDLNFASNEIYKQSLRYSLYNILSLVLFSNLGIHHKSSKKILKSLYQKLSIEASKEKIYDFIDKSNAVLAIYSEGIPVFSKESLRNKSSNLSIIGLATDEYNPVIEPKTQGLLILNELYLSNYLYNADPTKNNLLSSQGQDFLSTALINLSLNQLEFCLGYLTDSKDFFVKKQNLSKERVELSTIENFGSIDWEDQIYMVWSLMELYNTLMKTDYRKYSFKENPNYFKRQGLHLLNIITHFEKEILKIDTHELSNILVALVSTLNILDEKLYYKSFILSLCDELYSRLFNGGYILSEINSHKSATLATHFKAIEALTKGFQFTGYENFLLGAEKIYNKLNTAWDDDLGLFKIHRKKPIKYSSKLISYIIKGLGSLIVSSESLKTKKELINQLLVFLNSSMNNTHLQICPSINNSSSNEGLKDRDMVFEDFINNTDLHIFLDGFVLNPNDQEIIRFVDSFHPEFALYIVSSLLDLFLP